MAEGRQNTAIMDQVCAEYQVRFHWAKPQYSSVCSEHFTEADYDPSFLLKEEMGVTGRQKRVLPDKYPTLKTPKIRSGEQETSSGLSEDPLEEAGPSTSSTRSFTSTSVRPALNRKRRRVTSEKRQRKELPDTVNTIDWYQLSVEQDVEDEYKTLAASLKHAPDYTANKK